MVVLFQDAPLPLENHPAGARCSTAIDIVFDKEDFLDDDLPDDVKMRGASWVSVENGGQYKETELVWQPLDASPKYVGQCHSAYRHGDGTYQWTDGSQVRMSYSGEFCEDKRHGRGVLTWQDGRVFKGQFLENKLHGIGDMSWPDGRRYIGEYRFDRKCGVGTFLWPDGRKYEGHWQDGKRHGTGTYLNDKGIRKKGLWHKDQLKHRENVLDGDKATINF